MYNWSTDTTRLKKNSLEYQRYVVEQRVNYGLNCQKISAKTLKDNWELLDLDPSKKSYLAKVLWPTS